MRDTRRAAGESAEAPAVPTGSTRAAVHTRRWSSPTEGAENAPQAKLPAKPDRAGKDVKCPQCGKVVRFRAADPLPAPNPAEKRPKRQIATGKEDDLLARELGKLTPSAAKLGKMVVGDSIFGDFAGIGAAWGSQFAARFLPTEQFQLELRICADPRMVLAKVYAFLSSNGRVTDSDESQASPCPSISGVIGSGFLNMNPTLIRAEIVAIEGKNCSVILTGAAKEGLIKQRTAEKAVNRLAAALKALA